MKKIFFLGVLASCLLIIPTPASAQSTNLRYSCLKVEKCAETTCGSGSTHGHRAKLTSQPRSSDLPKPSKGTTYIAECFEVDTNNDGVPEITCSTRDANLDWELFCKGQVDEATCINDNFAKLKQVIRYTEGEDNSYGVYFLENGNYNKTNPKTVLADDFGQLIHPTLNTSLIIEWQSRTPDVHERKFIAFNKIGNNANSTTGEGGQQQGTLTDTYKNGSCQGELWDPDGRVFDSKTLEPIQNVDVTLLMKDATGNFTKAEANRANLNILNPFPKNLQGYFNFIVQAGLYKLSPMMGGYRMMLPEEKTTLPENYKFIYKPNTANKSWSLYFDGDIVDKKQGVLEQRDIPMVPTNGIGKHFDFSILTLNREVQRNGSEVFSGRVTHPFAELKVEKCQTVNNAKSCVPYKTYDSFSGGPDFKGEFNIILPQKENPDIVYEPIFTTVDLPAANLDFTQRDQTFVGSFVSKIIGIFRPKNVDAAEVRKSVRMRLEPIIQYVEGYAYDSNGNVMTGGTVGVYVPLAPNIPVYTTNISPNGFFKLTSDKLPTTEYNFKYISAVKGAEPVKVTTSQFLTQNADFIKAEKIDPYLYTTQQSDPRRYVTPSYVPAQKISPLPQASKAPSQVVTTTPQVNTTTGQSNRNNMFLVGAILLLVIATAGSLLGVYLYKKKKKESEM